MADFSTYLQNNPIPAQPKTLLQKVGGAISGAANGVNNFINGDGPGQLGNFGNAVGQAEIGGVKDSLNSAKAIPQDVVTGNGPKAIMDTTGIFGGLGETASAPITGALNASGASGAIGTGVNAAANAISNSPAIQKFAGSEAGQATGQLVQAGQNTMNFAGGVGLGDQVGDTIGNVKDLVTDHPIFKSATDTTSAPTSKTVASRTADIVPAETKDMVGQNIKNSAGEIQPRLTDTTGAFGQTSRTVNPTANEVSTGANEMQQVPNYPDKGTFLQKSQAVGNAIGTEAESMRAGLQAEDQANPLDANEQKTQVLNNVKANLPQDIQDRLGMLSPEDESFMEGMSKSAGTPVPEGGFNNDTTVSSGNRTASALPKTAMGRYAQAVSDAVSAFDGTREGLLNLRQAIDAAYEKAAGNAAWGSDSSTELDNTNKDIRDGINKQLADSTQNTDTQASLQKQSNLYRAKDALETKAKAQANSTISRFTQAHPLIGRILTRELMRGVITVAGGTALIDAISKLEKGG